MRIERLSLLRFGPFSDAGLEMPPGVPDLHIVAGRNEAGKTTTMAAIEDFLFGIPARTPYNFLHGYADLRVGAVVAAGEERLEAGRRKGKKDTLLDPQGVPLSAAEATLNRFLGGAEREFFRRMFSLSHGRLAEGGRAIAAADGEVGEALFSAGSGLRGLRQRRKQLDDEASNIFQKRKAATRVFYRATDRLTTAERALKQTIRRPEQWKSLKKQFDGAEEERRRLDEEYRSIAAGSRRVSRIRRVLPVVGQKIRLDEEIAALGDVVPLPDAAGTRAREATENATAAAAEIRFQESELQEKRAGRGAILVDTEAHERRAAIRELEDQRVKVLQMHRDLPKRHGELEAALDQVRRAAGDLGWDMADNRSLLDRIPSPRAVAALTELLQRRGGLEEARRAAEDTLRAAERRLEKHRSRVGGASSSGDAGRLAAILAATRGKADLDVRIREAKRGLEEIRERSGVLRGSLRPPLPDQVASEADLRAVPAPRDEVIRRHDDRIRDIEAKLDDVCRTLGDQRRQLLGDTEKRRRIGSGISGITRAALESARSERDGLWGLVHRHYIHQDPVPDAPADLAARLETATRRADAVADDRFERAEAAGRLAELDDAIRDRETGIEETVAAEAGLVTDRERFLAEWRSLWEGCPFEPGSPADMLDWRKTRDSLADATQSLRRAERALEALREEELNARTELSVILTGFGMAAEELEADSLPVLIGRGENVQREEAEAGRRQREALSELAKAKEECDRESQKLRSAEAAWTAWEREWKRALEQVGLDPASSGSGAVEAELLGEIREAAGRAQDLQSKRIDPMNRDIDAFKARVSALVSEIAPELAELPPEDAALRLSDRLEADLGQRKHRDELGREIAVIEDKIRNRRNALAESEGLLQPLYQAAGVKDLPALNAAIERSDRYRELTGQRDAALKRLEQDGDGFGFAELAAECANTNPDEAKAQEDAAESRRSELQQEHDRAVEAVVSIKQELEAFRDDAVAARLGAERQEALAAVRDAAERYARIRSAEMLLRWALERFRKEKQGPMLRRAGELFRTLTGDSFTSLQVDFDSKDRMRLDAVREDGDVVQVGGLSSGSEDQLYLALRVAAVEDYVGRAPALPFIADDLFVNFDEERAAAGFRILGELALKTQVLFFTHHEHLVEIAREVLGASLRVIRLDEA